MVVDAWEARWEAVPKQHRPPRPQLINSNLEDWDEIVDIAGLPPRIRPTAFAFGTLADGFLPVDAPFRQEAARMADGTHEHEEQVRQLLTHLHEIKLCSVVMKAVQASHPGIEGAASAIKLGDGGSESKVGGITACSNDSCSGSAQLLGGILFLLPMIIALVSIPAILLLQLEYDTRIPDHDLVRHLFLLPTVGNKQGGKKENDSHAHVLFLQDLVKARARELSKPKKIDSDAISSSLASAYDAVVHQRVLC